MVNRLLGPVLAAALACGGVGGTAAYRSLADAPAAPAGSSEQSTPAGTAQPEAEPARRPVVVRWSRCRPPAKPRGHVCVLRVVRTVER